MDRETKVTFRVEEATIAEIDEAMKAGRLTCRALVDVYLQRIEAYDKNGPALNAIVVAEAAISVFPAAAAKRGSPNSPMKLDRKSVV